MQKCNKCGQHHKRCKAHTRSGKPCNNGKMPGQNVCRMHGGLKPSAMRNGEARVAEQTRERLIDIALANVYGSDRPPNVDPETALLDAISWKYAEVVALRQQVSTVDVDTLAWGVTKIRRSEGGEEEVTEEAGPSTWLVLLHDSEDQLVRYAKAAHDAGIADRQIRLAEGQGRLLAVVVERVLDRLELTSDQRALVPVVVPAAFRALGDGQEA